MENQTVARRVFVKSRLYSINQLDVLIEKGSAAVSYDANRTKIVCRTVEPMNFIKGNNLDLLKL